MIIKFNKLITRLALLILLTSFTLTSCTKEEVLEIQNKFPFEVHVMPIPKEIGFGETIEIRVSIVSEGNFIQNNYYLRYFQFDGDGALRYYNDKPYIPNDLYKLSAKEFRLYYTSSSDVSQSFDIWIIDDFGIEEHLKFNFKSKKIIEENKISK